MAFGQAGQGSRQLGQGDTLMALHARVRLGWLALCLPISAVAAGQADLPLSREALFDLEPAVEKMPAAASGKAASAPDSKEALFDLAPGPSPAAAKETAAAKAALFGEVAPEPPKQDKTEAGWHGFVQGELAHTYASPAHWSKFAGRLELGRRGQLANGMQWKLGARLDYNAVYDIGDFYAAAVRRDQRAELHLRENYLDIPAGDWDFRLGRQHVVWGEMVGLFFADVVSAKDMREFVLQDFQLMRIPQWAARAEYFKDDFHAELIWIPFPSYDEVGKPGTGNVKGQYGSEFYGYPATPAGVVPVVLGERTPARRLGNTNFGLRLSKLTGGWDVAGFLYSSMDSSPTAYVVNKAGPVYRYELRHGRIRQAGATLAKDLGDVVLKAEAIYTGGRRYNVTDAADADGVVKQNTLDWVVGLDFNPGADTRLNVQLFQRIYFDHDPNILFDGKENGYSLLLNHKFAGTLEAEALLVRSLNRSDWMFRPKLIWNFERNWKWLFGVDVFGGPPTGLFGQFDAKDRMYTELRHDF